MWTILKNIAWQHRRKLVLTFSVVAAENLLFLAYPVFGGWAVDAVMRGNVWQALSYALLVWLMWFVGAAQRGHARIRTDLQRIGGTRDCGTARARAKPVRDCRTGGLVAGICQFF